MAYASQAGYLINRSIFKQIGVGARTAAIGTTETLIVIENQPQIADTPKLTAAK